MLFECSTVACLSLNVDPSTNTVSLFFSVNTMVFTEWSTTGLDMLDKLVLPVALVVGSMVSVGFKLTFKSKRSKPVSGMLVDGNKFSSERGDTVKLLFKSSATGCLGLCVCVGCFLRM